MTDKLKLGLKIWRYAYGLKMNFIMCGLLLLCSIALWATEFTGGRGTLFMSGYMLMVIGMVSPQLIYSLSMSGLVQSSPAGLRLQTAVPAVMTCLCASILYLFAVLQQGIVRRLRPDAGQDNALIWLAAMFMIIMLYMGVCYKYFIAATLLTVPALVMMLRFDLISQYMSRKFFGSGVRAFFLEAAVGLALIIIGSFLQYLLSWLVRKAPMSKMAQSSLLRKDL